MHRARQEVRLKDHSGPHARLRREEMTIDVLLFGQNGMSAIREMVDWTLACPKRDLPLLERRQGPITIAAHRGIAGHRTPMRQWICSTAA